MSNELAVGQVPDYLAKYVVAEKDKSALLEDFGKIEPSDWGLSFLKIVQSQERHALPGWGPTGTEQAMPQGTYVLNRSHAILPPGTLFVPVLRSRTYIKFRSRNIKDGIEFFTKDKDDHRITAVKGLDWKDGTDPKTGKPTRLPPEVSEFINFYIITPFNTDEPAIFSFSKTGMKVGKELGKNLFTMTTQKDLPMYMAQYRLLAPKVREGKGFNWFEAVSQFAGYVKETSIQRLKQMQTLARSIEAANQHISDIASNEEGTDAEENVPAALKQAPVQQTIDVQPTVTPVTQTTTTITAPVVNTPVAAPAAVAAGNPVSKLF